MTKYNHNQVLNSKDKLIIINSNVYDITRYIDEHPGGDILYEFIGRDSTIGYNEVGHSKDADLILEKLKIGTIADDIKKKKNNIIAFIRYNILTILLIISTFILLIYNIYNL
jgi:cytochrome b involved in lipid metabolism